MNSNLKNWLNFTNADGTELSDGTIDLFPMAYTVKFDTTTNGGMGTIADITGVPENGTITPPDAAGVTPPTDKYFKEWNSQANGLGTSLTASTAISAALDTADGTTDGEITFYAVYEDGWNVTFDAATNGGVNTGDLLTDNTVGVAKSLAGDGLGAAYPTDEPTKAGWAFKEWNTQADGTGTSFLADTGIMGDMTVHAQYEQSFTVTFDANAGNAAGVTVPSNMTNLAPGAHTLTAMTGTRTDYTFAGWNTAANGSGTAYTDGASVTLNNNLDLYAQWTYAGANPATLTFQGNGSTTNPAVLTPNSGAGSTDAYTATVGQGDTFKFDNFPDATRDDYTFDGWNTAADGTGTAVTTDVTAPVGGATYYATWTPDAAATPVKIEFNMNDGGTNAVHASGSIATNDVFAPFPADPVRAGYAFAGWNTEANNTGTAVTAATVFDAALTGGMNDVSGAKQVYARWSLERTVIFHENYDADATSTVTVADGTALGGNMPADPTRTGWEFVNWNMAANGSDAEFDATTTVNSDVDVYAQWSYTGANPVTVTFDGNGATTGQSPAGPLTVPVDSTLGSMMPSAPTRTNYIFKEWNSVQNGTGTVFAADTQIPADLTVYAQWKGATDPVTVTFQKGSGSQPDPASITVNKGDAIGAGNMPAAPTRTDFTFKGWVVDDNGDGKFTVGEETDLFDGTTAVNGDTKVVAWFELEVDVSLGTNPVYDGTAQAPELAFVVAGTTTPVNSLVEGVDYKLTYDTNGDTTFNDPAPSDAGTYAFEVVPLSDELLIGNAPGTFTIAPKPIVFAVSGQEVKGDGASGAAAATVAITTTGTPLPVLGTDYTVGYYLWIDNGDGVIDTGELAPAPETAPQTLGKYVMKINFTGNNYVYDDTNSTGDEYSAGQIGIILGAGEKFKYQIQREINFAITNQKQATDGATSATANVTVQEVNGTLPVDGTDYTVTYQLWTDANGDNVIDSDELGTATGAPTAYGKYVMGIKITNGNFFLGAKSTGDKYPSTVDALERFSFELEPATKTVTFKYNNTGATTVLPDVVKVIKFNENIDHADTTTTPGMPADPTGDAKVPDQEFDGWYIDANSDGVWDTGDAVPFEATTPVTDSWTVVAKWKTSTISTLASMTIEGEKTDGTTVYSIADADIHQDAIGGTVPFDRTNPDSGHAYYLRIPNDVDKYVVTLTGTEPGATYAYQINGGAAASIPNGADATKLPVAVTSNGSFDKIEIVVTAPDATTTSTYTFHVQRLQPVTLALGYGNSPYGEIMKDAAITDKGAAKAGFDNSDGVNAENLQFAPGYIPAGVQTGIKYTATAWRSYNTYDNGQPYNGDKDETAIFVYQGADFRDPGFKVINQLGQEEAAPTAAVSFTLKKYTSAGLVSYTTAVVDETFTATGNGELYSLAGMMIRPDVYEVTYTYSYTDLLDGTAKTETVTRRLIVLCKRGDISLSTVPAINTTDVNNMKKNVGSLGSSSFNSLVAYRALDIANGTVPAINTTDVNNLSKNIGSIGAATAIQYYRGL